MLNTYWPNCPACGSDLKMIAYGLFDGPPGEWEVYGGCDVGPNDPNYVCPTCSWTGDVHVPLINEPLDFNILGFWDKDSQKVFRTFAYSKNLTGAEVRFLDERLPGWITVTSKTSFINLLAFEKPLQGFSLSASKFKPTQDDLESEPFNFGSQVIGNFIDGREVSLALILREGSLLENDELWPEWFTFDFFKP